MRRWARELSGAGPVPRPDGLGDAADELLGVEAALTFGPRPLLGRLAPLAPIALRTALGCALAGYVSLALGVGRPYWALVTAASLYQANVTLTWSRGVQRVVGNLVGVLAFAVLAPLAHVGQAVLVLCCLALNFGAEALIGRNYWLGSVCVTPMALLITEFAHAQQPGRLITDRVLDTLVGALVGFVAAVAVTDRRWRPYRGGALHGGACPGTRHRAARRGAPGIRRPGVRPPRPVRRRGGPALRHGRRVRRMVAARPAGGAGDAGGAGRTPYARGDGTTPGTALPGGRTGMTTADGRGAADGDAIPGGGPVPGGGGPVSGHDPTPGGGPASHGDPSPGRPVPVDTVAGVVRQWGTVLPDLDTGPMEVIGRVNRCAALLQQAEDAPLRRAGLTRPEFDVLGTLRRTGHELTPSEIARETFSSGAAVTKRLKQLTERGLVERRGDPRDRRVAHVRLTDAGRALVDGVLPDQLAYETGVLSGIDPERQRELAGLLGELLGQLEGRLRLPRA